MADKNKYSIVEGKLYNYKSMKVQLNSYKIDLEYLSKEYRGCRGKSYRDIRVKTNGFYSSVESELIDKEKQIEELQLKIKKKQIEISKLENALFVLDDKELELVKCRYFSNTSKPPTWNIVAQRIGRTENTCRNMRNRIINKLEKII